VKNRIIRSKQSKFSKKKNLFGFIFIKPPVFFKRKREKHFHVSLFLKFIENY